MSVSYMPSNKSFNRTGRDTAVNSDALRRGHPVNLGVRAHKMIQTPKAVLAYYAAEKPLVCELDVNPYLCEFWPLDELSQYNIEYEVPQYAPGYFGFATSGGGEMFAISPSGEVIRLPFIGMEPKVARTIAPSWSEFESMLRNAL